MLGVTVVPVKARQELAAAALSRPPRTASLRRFLAAVLEPLAAAPAPGWREALAGIRRGWLDAPAAATDDWALGRLLAEDLGPLLEPPPGSDPVAEAWADPAEALGRALGRMSAALVRLGLPLEPVSLHVAADLPAPYRLPMLVAVSIDRADAAAYGLTPGIHLSAARLLPVQAERALGHALIHASLGQRSPERLGRGLEEGIGELLGGLYLAGEAIGGAAAVAAFDAFLRTPTLSEPREELLAWTRGAALIHRRHGLAGLLSLVRQGRDAVKSAEAALASGRPDTIALAAAPPDRWLEAAASELLEARPRPVAVRPLAFLLATRLAAGLSLPQAAADLGLEPGLAAAAAHELQDPRFLAVLSPAGEVLAEDLGLLLGSGLLRYRTGGP